MRDMNDDELSAYWEGFREIMLDASEKIHTQSTEDVSSERNETDIAVAPPDQEACLDSSSMTTVKKRRIDEEKSALVQAPSMHVAPTKRLRKKTPAAQAAISHEDVRNLRKTVVARSNPLPKKRSYVPKVAIARDGKRPCVSIWTKVQLCKESCTVYSIYVLVFKVGKLTNIFYCILSWRAHWNCAPRVLMIRHHSMTRSCSTAQYIFLF